MRNAADRWVLGLWRGVAATADQAEDGSHLANRVAAFEKSVIEAELARHGGRQKETYEALGISRKGLYDKMRKFGIRSSDDG